MRDLIRDVISRCAEAANAIWVK